MNRTLSAAVICTVIAASPLYAGSAFAHHSFAMFDRTQTSVIDGTIKELQWTSPHVWVELMAPDKDGKVVEYGFESGPPGLGRGWTRHSLKPGDKVKISYHPLRTGALGGEFVQATFADGTTVPARNAGPGPGPGGPGGGRPAAAD